MSDTIYRSRWDACDDCEVVVIVERDDDRGVPEVDEWEPFPSCPLCGTSLSFGNADEDTVADQYWRKGLRAAQKGGGGAA